MIDLTGMISMSYLKKSRFTGSYKGMRYALHRQTPEEGGVLLEAVVWPEPYNYETTPEERKQQKSVSFSQEGLEEAVSWLNKVYEDGSY